MNSDVKRRSDRVLLTLPLRAQGVDAEGRPFECQARTVNVNRHGGQVKIPIPLKSGQEVRVVNLASAREADFRVIRSLSPTVQTGGDYGVECLEDTASLWQIQFPLRDEEKPADALALLECRGCQTIQLANLSLTELNVLRTIGVLAKPCDTCEAVSPFRYAEIRLTRELPALLGWTPTVGRLMSPRRHRRALLQLPLGIRNEKDEVEVTRSENVSKEGYCFTTKKDYPVGRFILVAFPGDPEVRELETLAQVVWRESIQGAGRYAYGVHTTPSVPSSEKNQRPARASAAA